MLRASKAALSDERDFRRNYRFRALGARPENVARTTGRRRRVVQIDRELERAKAFHRTLLFERELRSPFVPVRISQVADSP